MTADAKIGNYSARTDESTGHVPLLISTRSTEYIYMTNTRTDSKLQTRGATSNPHDSASAVEERQVSLTAFIASGAWRDARGYNES